MSAESPLIKINPPNSQLSVYLSQGYEAFSSGNLTQAVSQFKSALFLDPKNSDALHYLADISVKLKHYPQAVSYLYKLLEQNRSSASIYNTLGYVLKQLNRLNEALTSYYLVISVTPEFPDAYLSCADLLVELKRYTEAVGMYDKAILLKPDYFEAYNNRGVALKELKKIEEALNSYAQAIAIKPDAYEAYNNRGDALIAAKRLDEALLSINQAIAIKLDYFKAYNNRGNALLELKRLDEAFSSYSQAALLEPSNLNVKFNLGLYHLLTGNFKAGWVGYEARLYQKYSTVSARNQSYTQPLWHGTQKLIGKTLLVYAEQGLGDTIQFSRYIPLLSNLGATVIFEVQPSLVKLFSQLKGVNTILAKGETLPAFDYHCPLLSLPERFNTQLDTIPPVSHPITLENSKIKEWLTRLGPKLKTRVGLVWSGSTIHKKDHTRSVSLSELIPYLPPHLDYISLQKEISTSEEALLNKNDIKHFGSALHDFTDTAALVQHMDLILAVDTSVAHLSATLCKSTWILIAYSPDWRWLLERSDSPWYPSVTLVRQTHTNEWQHCLTQVKLALEKLPR